MFWPILYLATGGTSVRAVLRKWPKGSINLSLRNRFAVWTSSVLVASGLGLILSVYLVSSRELRRQAGEEMDVVVNKTSGELDLWINSRQRDAVNLSELESL